LIIAIQIIQLMSFATFLDQKPVKVGLIGASCGFLTSLAYYALTKPKSQGMARLRAELISELQQHPVKAPKDPKTFTFTKEFMVMIYRLLYTYEQIAKQLAQEEHFEKRVRLLQEGKGQEYRAMLETKNDVEMMAVREVKEMIFDYFNIIQKEFELSYEKYKEDEEYQKKNDEIKDFVDSEYIQKKVDLPPALTKEKAVSILQTKSQRVQTKLMAALQNADAEGGDYRA